ncbi:hypothetical protein [Deinococcus sp.]|uniref:hypothetical protein n=1 Tax=Deinococcus sp. TaxID=47478 RepID=UPI00286D8EA0|nr:hypothetical protein [Deinococcus sp.]
MTTFDLCFFRLEQRFLTGQRVILSRTAVVVNGAILIRSAVDHVIFPHKFALTLLTLGRRLTMLARSVRVVYRQALVSPESC